MCSCPVQVARGQIYFPFVMFFPVSYELIHSKNGQDKDTHIPPTAKLKIRQNVAV